MSAPLRPLQSGDTVAVREKARKQLRVTDAFKLADSVGLPAWVSVDGGKLEGDSRFYSTFTGPAVYTDADKFRKVSFEDIEKGHSRFG